MLQIKDLSIVLSENKKEIVHNVNLEISPGEVHLLNGNNGSGKSTLVNTIMGNPNFTIRNGSICLKKEKYDDFIFSKINQEAFVGNALNINELDPNERSLLGLYLANQYPIEIPGVSLSNFLRLIYNARRLKEDQLPVFKFKSILEQKAEIINYPKHLLKRNLNEGFSGGEKKKTEILQMLILEPKYIMLDEIDSGLDRNSVEEVFSGIANFKKKFPLTALIIITHYDRVQEFLKPDFVHEMQEGVLTN